MRRPAAMLVTAGLVAAFAAGLAGAQETTVSPKPAAPTPTPAATPPPIASPAPTTAPIPPNDILAQVPVASPGDTPATAAPPPAAPKPVEAPKPPPEPLKRPRFDTAILQGVDKITAETLRFEAKVGAPVRYKGLILTVRACETTAADEDINDSVAYVEVQSQPEVLAGRVAAPPRQVFKGWMFASSPTLHPFEHPVYDLWLVACKAAA
jgi:hypothetical protein